MSSTARSARSISVWQPAPFAGRDVLVDDRGFLGIPAQRIRACANAGLGRLRIRLVPPQLIYCDQQLVQRQVRAPDDVHRHPAELGIPPQVAADDEDAPQHQHDRHAERERRRRGEAGRPTTSRATSCRPVEFVTTTASSGSDPFTLATGGGIGEAPGLGIPFARTLPERPTSTGLRRRDAPGYAYPLAERVRAAGDPPARRHSSVSPAELDTSLTDRTAAPGSISRIMS